MHLLCNVCGAVQSVASADEADEDPRTQGIRRAFRAEHAVCGERTVSLVFAQEAAEEPVVSSPWMTAHPDDVKLDAEGHFVREIERDGLRQAVRVCEDCWKNMPRYVDFPLGLTSPESDGVNGQGGKTRMVNVDGKRGVEHVRKAVCLTCYFLAFERVYPGQAWPKLCPGVVGDGSPIAAPLPPVDEAFVSEPGQDVTQ